MAYPAFHGGNPETYLSVQIGFVTSILNRAKAAIKKMPTVWVYDTSVYPLDNAYTELLNLARRVPILCGSQNPQQIEHEVMISRGKINFDITNARGKEQFCRATYTILQNAVTKLLPFAEHWLLHLESEKQKYMPKPPTVKLVDDLITFYTPPSKQITANPSSTQNMKDLMEIIM